MDGTYSCIECITWNSTRGVYIFFTLRVKKNKEKTAFFCKNELS